MQPHLDYDDIKLEILQYNAALAIIGAIRDTSREKITINWSRMSPAKTLEMLLQETSMLFLCQITLAEQETPTKFHRLEQIIPSKTLLPIKDKRMG